MSEERIFDIRVKDMMTKDVLVVSPQDTILSVAKKMQEKKVGSVIVGKGIGQPIDGIFTERDMVFKVAAANVDIAKTPISAVMSTFIKSLKPNATFSEAFYMVYIENIRHIPILEDDNLAGIISMRDLYHRFFVQMSKLVRQKEES